MVPITKGAERPVKDYMLTRYACYLISQKDLQGESAIKVKHVQKNSSVRSMLDRRCKTRGIPCGRGHEKTGTTSKSYGEKDSERIRDIA